MDRDHRNDKRTAAAVAEDQIMLMKKKGSVSSLEPSTSVSSLFCSPAALSGSSSPDTMWSPSSSQSNATPCSEPASDVAGPHVAASNGLPCLPKWNVPEHIRKRLLMASSGRQQVWPNRSAEETPRVRSWRSCSDCSTTNTPLWRSGPNGPKSLCNACGIRYRKWRRMGMEEDAQREKKEWCRRMLKRISKSSMPEKRRLTFRRKFAEEEEAAVMLLAMSQGLIN